MASLTGVLANIPGLAGYTAQQQLNNARAGQVIGDVSGLQGLYMNALKQKQLQDAATRDAQYKSELAALGPNPTQDQLAQVAAKYAPPQNVLSTLSASADRRAQIEALKQQRADQLGMQQQMLDLRREQFFASNADKKARDEFDRQYKTQSLAIQKQLADLKSQAGNAAPKTLNTANGVLQWDATSRSYKPMLGPDGKPVMPANTFAATQKELSKAEGQQKLSDLISTLDNAYEELHKQGAIIDTNASPLSNAMNWISSSGVGQAVGRIVGTRAQQYRDTINMMRPSIINAIKQKTGMGATQLNSNVELQFYLQAATDPSRSYQVNKAALEVLDKQYGLGLGIKADPNTVAALRGSAPKVSQPTTPPANQGWSIKPVP